MKLQNKIISVFLLAGVLAVGCILPKPPFGKTPIKKPGVNNKTVNAGGESNEIVTPKSARLYTGTNIVANLKIDTNTTYFVDPKLYNFSLGFMYGNALDEIPELQKLTKALKPNVFRYPGGTVANYYHMTGAGYGMKENEINGVPIYQLNQKSKAAMSNNMIDRFIPMVKENNAKVLFVANLKSGTPQETVEILKKFRSNGIEIIGIELGNELYYKANEKEFPNVEAYLKKCEDFVPIIKAYDKTIPIGVLACPLGGGANRERFRAWNELMGKQSFADAYIVHEYTQCKPCNQNANTDLSWVFNDCGMTVGSITSNNIRQFVLDYYKQFFGNKKQWITEWNIINADPYMVNTFFQGAHNGDYMLNVIDVNAKNNNAIDVISFHSFAGDGLPFPMLFYKENQKTPIMGNNQISATASYFSFYYFRKIFQNNSRKCDQTITLSDGSTEKDIIVRSFLSFDKKKIYLYCINKTGVNSSLNISGINIKGSNYEYIQGDNLWSLASPNNNNYKNFPGSYNIMQTYSKNIPSNENITIPSYSFGCIEISM
jgi:hypothetical protein